MRPCAHACVLPVWRVQVEDAGRVAAEEAAAREGALKEQLQQAEAHLAQE
jgi:hypothetical protein